MSSISSNSSLRFSASNQEPKGLKRKFDERDADKSPLSSKAQALLDQRPGTPYPGSE